MMWMTNIIRQLLKVERRRRQPAVVRTAATVSDATSSGVLRRFVRAGTWPRVAFGVVASRELGTVTVVIAPSRLPLEGPCTCCMRERVARHRPGEGPKLSEMPRCLRALNLRPRAHEQSSVVASLLRN